MKNFERFSTPDERTNAFYSFCKSKGVCKNCELKKFAEFGRIVRCSNAWLELEAEDEKPLPCPFCGSRTYCKQNYHSSLWHVQCSELGCDYRSCSRIVRSTAIDEHNRIVQAAISQKTKTKNK